MSSQGRGSREKARVEEERQVQVGCAGAVSHERLKLWSRRQMQTVLLRASDTPQAAGGVSFRPGHRDCGAASGGAALNPRFSRKHET